MDKSCHMSMMWFILG